jgi:hypothetical protein
MRHLPKSEGWTLETRRITSALGHTSNEVGRYQNEHYSWHLLWILLSTSGPAGVLSQRVNQMLRVPDLDGDARRIHGDLSWFGQKKALRPAGGGGRVLYFLAPKCLRRGYKLWEREPSLGLKGKVRVQRRLLEMLICGLCAFAYLRLRCWFVFHCQRVLPLTQRRLWLDEMTPEASLEGSKMSHESLPLDEVARRARWMVGSF